MRKQIAILIIVFASFQIAAVPTSAYDAIPHNCEYTDGAYYQSNLFPRYEGRNQRLVLVDWNTGEVVQEIETTLQISQFRVLGWSPDCRYLVASLRQPPDHTLMIWDMVAGSRAAAMQDVHSISSGLYWSPDAQELIIGIHSGTYLWKVAENHAIQLMTGGARAYDLHWDDQRGEVWVLPGHYVATISQVTVFRRADGQPLASYDNLPGYDKRIGFTFSDDGSKVIVYSKRSWNLKATDLTIWNRDKSANLQIQTTVDGQGRVPAVALSPDNRYLVIGGRHNLRVWDLQNLTSVDGQTPPLVVYAGVTSSIRSAHFIDNSIVETIDWRGRVQRWDLHSG